MFQPKHYVPATIVMKKKELEKLRLNKIEELRKQVEDEKRKLVELRIKHAVGEQKNVRALKNKRLTIAQILTIIREKELEENA